MRRLLYVLAGLFGLILVLWAVGRMTGALQYYNVPTGGNEPAIKPGDKLFASNLKSPKRFDLICYKRASIDPEGREEVWIHRLCGMPGDQVEIRRGVLYVNGEQADSGLNLKFPYSIHKKDFALIADKVPAADVMPAGADSMTVNLTTRFLKENAVAATRQLLAPSYIDNEIMGMYNKVWNHDNFGPFLVPAGHYFVLGDNRSYAMDSRYIGPIHADKVVGVVLK